MDMAFRLKKYSIFWILTVLWAMTSCASSSDLTPDPVFLAIPTLTPFQPQPETSATFYVMPVTPQVERP